MPVVVIAKKTQDKSVFRIRSAAVLLTYMGLSVEAWQSFVDYVEAHLDTGKGSTSADSTFI